MAWSYGNRPKLETKWAVINCEAIAQLVEIQRFAWGYDWGKVTAATATTLVDDTKHWETDAWTSAPVGNHFVAVRHNIGTDPEGDPIYLWEWAYIYISGENTLTLSHNWKRTPSVGSPYLITPEYPWAAWMWDERIAAGWTHPVTEVFYPNIIQLEKFPIVWHQRWQGHADRVICEGELGLFASGPIPTDPAFWANINAKAELYGGNAEEVFETEVSGTPAAKGEYKVDYAAGQIEIYSNSPRPQGVKARYVAGVHPPGFEGGDKGSIGDFTWAHRHFSVKGESNWTGTYRNDMPLISDNANLMLDTFTALRLQIAELCSQNRIWNTTTDAFHTVQSLYNAAKVWNPAGTALLAWDQLYPGQGWNADLSRGVGRTLPEGGIDNYGRTWVLAIEEILKCLEQMTWIVFPHLTTSRKQFYRVGDDQNAIFATAKANAKAEYDAASWLEGTASFGMCGSTNYDGVDYYCVQCGMYANNRSGRLVLVFPTKYRKGYSADDMTLWFDAVARGGGYGDFASFTAQVYVDDDWDYGDTIDETVGDDLAGSAATGTTGTTFEVTLDKTMLKVEKPTLVSVRHSDESKNMIPDPPGSPGNTYAREYIDFTGGDSDKVYLLVKPELTYI